MENKILKLKYILPFFTLLLSNCKKEEIEGFDSQPTMAKVALINFANPATNAPALGYLVKVDGVRKYDAPLPYGTTTGYLAIPSGERTISLDSSRVNIQAPTAEGSVWSSKRTLAADKYYSLIPSGNLRNPDVLFVEDNISSPSSGKAKVRFINVAPDSPQPINIFYRLATEAPSAMKPLFATNRAYKEVADFIEIPKGAYIVDVRRADGVVISTFSGIGAIDPTVDPSISGGVSSSTVQINFKEGKVYTMMLRGYISTAAAQANSNVTLSTVINRFW